MKILVISDSHGRVDLVQKCILQHTDAEAVFFLGDVLSDIKGMDRRFPDKQFFCVRGNCDYDADVPLERLVTLQGTCMLLTHGHAHGVNYGLGALESYARKREAKIALFGHTHVPFNQYHDGVYLMNPGSLSRPRDCSRASYGLIEITPRGILVNTADFHPYL